MIAAADGCRLPRVRGAWTRVCLRCRVLVAGERCELDGKHRVVDLATAAGVAAFGDEIWSAPRFSVGSTPEGRTAALGALSVGTVAGTVALGPVALLAVPAALGAHLVMRAFGRRTVENPRGIGAYLRQSYSRRLRRTGALEGDNCLTAPFSGRRCIGYSFFFCARESFGGAIMLAGGCHGGFFLRGTDDADWEVMAEAGSFRLAIQGAEIGPAAGYVASGSAVERFVARFHQSLAGEREGRPVLPYDSVVEICVRSGDRVEAYGPIVASPFSYRSSGRQFRFARVPQLLVLDAEAAGGAR